MIEKLKVVIKPEDWKLPVDELEMRCLKNLLSKVDELVDAVNELQKHEEQHLDLLTQLNEMRLQQNKEPAENTQDQYAKYRKWNGKLCRFWNMNKEYAIYGILEEVKTDWAYRFKAKDEQYLFDHCELVKPDDDIIYKGE